MKIVTWNINSLRLRMQHLKLITEEIAPDVIALQETKVNDPLFPLGDCLSLGYPYVRFSGQASYNGTAILSKFPIEDTFSLDILNNEKRHIAVRINGIELHNFYVPAGGDVPDGAINPKFLYKLNFIDFMQDWFQQFRHNSQKIILLGDLNIAPYEHDVWSSRQLANVVSHTDIERKKLLRNMEQFGWIDTLRINVPMNHKLYTWWSYRNIDWQKSDRGRRLDHIWVSQALKSNIFDIKIFKDFRSLPNPSDHVPVMLELTRI